MADRRGTRLQCFQDFIKPLWSFTSDGCRPNQETWAMIAAAGFTQVELEHFRSPEVGPAGPHIAGTAVK